jgi:hypothetical protein
MSEQNGTFLTHIEQIRSKLIQSNAIYFPRNLQQLGNKKLFHEGLPKR